MNKLIFVSLTVASAIFAQTVSQSTRTDSSRTTVIQDNGKKTATDSATATSTTDANGVTTNDSSKRATKTKKKHGKVVSKKTATETQKPGEKRTPWSTC